MELSSKLKELRKLRNWTQRDLAYFSGVSLDSIRGYEINKTTNITKKNLQKIASAFGISETDFYFNNLSVSENEKMSVSQTKLKEAEKESFYYIPKLNISASAGGGNELEGLECYESGELMAIDKAFFKTIPSSSIKAIRVDGYSMTPMLFPDSWVIFEESADFKGDGLYVLNYNGQLMVKLLQLNPFENILEIISVNKEYKSYSIKLDESQTPLFIKGKVLRSVI